LAEARLVQLEERWQRDPGSRIFLQLAEELRRVGRLPRAIEVLRQGLELHPGYPSAQVALGRCLLEAGETRQAAEILEAALAHDPTQLVATKLAVEAHLRNGESTEARARLELYRLFNDRDDEIAALETRLRVLESGERVTAAAAAPAVDSGPGPDEPFGWPAAAPAPAPLEFAPEARPSLVRDEMPFGRWSVAGSAALVAGACRREGIFPVAEAAAVALVAPPEVESWAPEATAPFEGPAEEAETPAGAPATAEPAAAEPLSEPAIAGALSSLPSIAAAPAEAPFERIPPPAMPAPPEAAEVTPAARAAEPIAPPWAGASRVGELERDEAVFATPFSPREIGAEVERETIEEPFDEVYAPPSPPPRLPEPPAGAPAATVTLGRLYLEQGHLDSAEETFRAVLATRPADAAALAGLRETELRRGALAAEEAEETASGWGRGDSGPGERAPGSLTERKIRALRGYLSRIRRGADSRVS